MTEITKSDEVIYGMTFLVKDEDNINNIRRILENNGARISDEKPLQKIRLAYPIKKNIYGFMGFLRFSINPETVNKLDAAFKLEDNLLRHTLNRAIIKGNRVVEAAPVYRAREEKKNPPLMKESAKDFEPALTNEALEKKIEEILK